MESHQIHYGISNPASSITRTPAGGFASTGASKPGDVSLTWEARLPMVQDSHLRRRCIWCVAALGGQSCPGRMELNPLGNGNGNGNGNAGAAPARSSASSGISNVRICRVCFSNVSLVTDLPPQYRVRDGQQAFPSSERHNPKPTCPRAYEPSLPACGIPELGFCIRLRRASNDPSAPIPNRRLSSQCQTFMKALRLSVSSRLTSRMVLLREHTRPGSSQKA